MQVKTTARYSASKMNKILTQASTRTNPEGIILAELSQSPEERAPPPRRALERQIQGPRADGGAGLGRKGERPVFGGTGRLFRRVISRRVLEVTAGLAPQQCQRAQRHRAVHVKVGKALPQWSSGKEPACQRRGHRLDPWSRKTPHAEGQESPCATSMERARPRACARDEKPLR